MASVARRIALPLTAAGLTAAGTVLKKAVVVSLLGVGVPVAGHQFIQAIMSSRAHALKRAEDRQIANRTSRVAASDETNDLIVDLQTSVALVSQMQDRPVSDALQQPLAESVRVLERADVRTRAFRRRLLSDPTVTDDEIREMEHIEALSDKLRLAQRTVNVAVPMPQPHQSHAGQAGPGL